MNVVLTETAYDDLLRIGQDIQKDNPTRAAHTNKPPYP